MKTASVTVLTQEVELPNEIITGKLRISLAGPVNQVQEIDGVDATFADLVAGDYTITAERLDSNGNVLGQPASANFTVTVEMYAAPVSITVSLA